MPLTRPRLKPTIEPFPAPDGDLYLLRANGADVAIRSPDAGQRALLAALDGRRTGDELGVDDATITQLADAGLVEDAADDDVLAPGVRERFDRQLRYFGDMPGPGRAVAQCALGEASVLLIGAGGLGSWTAYALVSAGIGRLVVVDGDEVELSNLNRQILYGEPDLGRPKAVAAAERLRAFSSCTEVVAAHRHVASPEEVAQLVAGHDVVIDLADMPVGELQRWIDRACFAARIPYIASSQAPPVVRIGPLYLPGTTGCFGCQEAAWREQHPLYDAIDRWRRHRRSEAAAFGPACGLIGSLIANDVVNHLTGIAEPASLGRAVMLDVNTLERRVEEVPRRAGCERCDYACAPMRSPSWRDCATSVPS